MATAKKILAAVAYFGAGGSELIRFKNGDHLVVDMSLRAVKQGMTDPKEIRKLIRRGVQVFTRASLHAKLFVTPAVVIAGSANVSRNSYRRLDEAGLISDDSSAVRRACAFVDRISTEPVRPEYLKKCIKAYRPPLSHGESAPQTRGKKAERNIQAKLWFVGGLVDLELREDARRSLQKIEKKYEKAWRSPI